MVSGDTDRAISIWREADQFQQERSVETWINVRWHIADCLCRKGQIEEARVLYLKVLEESVAKLDKSNILQAQIGLAGIDLFRHDLVSADKRIAYLAKQKHVHRDQVAYREWLIARRYVIQGELTTAREAYQKAVDLFERLGMRRELAEIREELAKIATNS
jgi:tetratricopeptide (TPR) repeat protein